MISKAILIVYIVLRLFVIYKMQTYSGILTSYLDIFNHIAAYLEPCVTFPNSSSTIL